MDAPTLRCRSCGGPVAAGDVRCPYCDSQLATIACPKCFALVSVEAEHCPKCGAAVARGAEPEPRSLGCPVCREPMLRSEIGGTELRQCSRCGGAWLGRGAFEHLVEGREERSSFLDALPEPRPQEPAQGAMEFSYRPCPACARLMNRSNYARVSGVIVDTCREHGIWFDPDELRRVLAFIENGGLKRASQHEQAALQAERDRLRDAVSDARRGEGAASLGGILSGPVDRSGAGHLLGEILVGAAATLWGQLKR